MINCTAIFDEHAGRDGWLEARKSMVTASDVACLFGLNPYKTRDQLRMEKLGLADEDPATDAMFWGSELEGSVLAGYAKKYGRIVRRCGILFRSNETPALGATLDAIEYDEAGETVLEVKCPGAWAKSNGWAAKGPDGKAIKPIQRIVPMHYQMQAQCAMYVTGLHRARVVALFGGRDLEIFEVTRNADALDLMCKEATAFMSEIQTALSEVQHVA